MSSEVGNMADWQEILIELVRERQCLWDKFHPDYKDARNIKRNNWKDVTRELNLATNIEHSGTIFNMLFWLRLSLLFNEMVVSR